MSPKTVVSRTYPRVPYAAFDKNGEPLDLKETLDGVRKDAELVSHYALREMTEQNLALVTYFDRLKPSGAGYMMGLKLPVEAKKQFKSGSSRLERIIYDPGPPDLGPLTKPIVATSLLGGGGLSRVLNQKTCNLGFLFLLLISSTGA